MTDRNFRKARVEDLDQIEAIYLRIHAEEAAGSLTVGWLPGVYPVRQTAAAALERGDLYVCEESGHVTASAVINSIQVPEYVLGDWQVMAGPEEILVLHTLTVDPLCAHRGIGGDFVSFYEKTALQRGCRALRMDTNRKNTRARRFYQKLGYREIGIVPCCFNGIPDVDLVLLEKPV